MAITSYGKRGENEIQPGMPWAMTARGTRSTAWESADLDHWRVRIHPVKGGGEAAVTKNPVAAVLSNSDKTITLTFSVTGAETAEIVSPPERSFVQIERKVGDEWEPLRASAATVDVLHRPGAR